MTSVPGPAAPVRTLAASLSLPVAFGLPIGLSAFLLFTAQPMTGRLALPVYGGAPALWAAILVLFQVALLLGYLWAHLLATRVPPRLAPAVHVGAVAAAAAWTAAGPWSAGPAAASGTPSLPGILVALAATVGPAAVAMAATTPLVSAWYWRARTGGAAGRDPYWLYALGNLGSLASLLAYPFVVEPLLGLAAQRAAWTGGLWLLVAALAVAGARALAPAPPARGRSPGSGVDPVRTGHDPAGAAEGGDGPAAPPAGPGRRRVVRWAVLAAVPSGLLAAVTNLVTTDLVSAPLLWVVPLATYLATWVAAFAERGRRLVRVAVAAGPAGVTLLWVPLGSSAGWPLLALLAAAYGAFAVTALAIHARLAADRPPPAGLTAFYLVIAAGGAVGGAFTGLLAPAVFPGVWEYPILVTAAAAALALGAAPPPAPRGRPVLRLLEGWRGRAGPYAVVAALLLAALVPAGPGVLEPAARWLGLGLLVLALGRAPRLLAAATGVLLVLATAVLAPPAVFRDRSFFGVLEVRRDATATVLLHGTTAHGIQAADPAGRDDPGSYYARGGPVDDLFGVLAERPPLAVRLVGLGAGSMAVYGRPGDTLAFVEIDPLVVRVARDPELFTYLRDARAAVTVELADGRRALAADPATSADLVVLDAFSSDAVPAHLLTREALAEAVRVLRPGGLLAVHVSNRYYDLEPPVAGALADLGLAVLRRAWTPPPDRPLAAETAWLVAGAREAADAAAALDALGARGWEPATAGPFLTDDRADLLRFLRLR